MIWECHSRTALHWNKRCDDSWAMKRSNFSRARAASALACTMRMEPVNVIEWDRCIQRCENRDSGIDAVKRWKLTAGDVRDVELQPIRRRSRRWWPSMPAVFPWRQASHRDARDMSRGHPRRSASEAAAFLQSVEVERASETMRISTLMNPR